MRVTFQATNRARNVQKFARWGVVIFTMWTFRKGSATGQVSVISAAAAILVLTATARVGASATTSAATSVAMLRWWRVCIFCKNLRDSSLIVERNVDFVKS